ncbi:MAG TPA: adenine deaminase [Candidatus Deferrimicrobiaceae bacterium]|nr:adenine deaminase [Candidatus Deferrimicrobiaceae bacterium]
MSRFIEGNIVDVIAGEIFPGRVVHRDGVIRAVERLSGTFQGFLLPGFIDAHIHVDSSLLCPSRFAEAVVPRGTTAVVTDPHEIANVLGRPGISYMKQDASGVPLRFYFTAPSCVPATPFETAGASLGAVEVEALLKEDDVVALGEVMNYLGAVGRDPVIVSKIQSARRIGKPIDGHCPLLSGDKLKEYINLGISTDHECTHADEAREKHSLGMRILVRQGSVAKNLEALAPFARENDFFLVSDDMLAPDLLGGHLDRTLARAVALGIDPLHAVRAVTLRPADHYRLPVGAIAAGRAADITKVRDLSSFEVEDVYIGGRLVAAGRAAVFRASPVSKPGTFAIPPRRASDFTISAPGPNAAVRVIVLIRDEIVTADETAVMRVEGGRVPPDTERDILLISVVNRYRDAPVSCGFVKGFGLKAGAIASSVAHDAHNIVVVGADPDDMAGAVNTIIRESGGFCLSAGGVSISLPLGVAGLMSTEPPRDVGARLDLLQRRARELGCLPDWPFMTMSFLSLLVVPRLKIGDRGLFDVDASRFVDAVIPNPSRG